jgi:hypothetical protein
VGSAFVLVAGLWALVQVLMPITTPPGAAARAFANGKVAANELDDPLAIGDFNRALALRPKFVDAYIQRAAVEYDQGIPHLGTGPNALPTTAGADTIPSVAALDRATADLEHAHDDGSTAATLFEDLSIDLTYRGLLTNNNADLTQSRDHAERAIKKVRDQSDAGTLLSNLYFQVAEDDLALGRAEATQEWRTARAQMRNADVATEYIVGPALTDLSLIETERPKLTGRVDALKEAIVSEGEITYPSKAKPYETTPGGYLPRKDFITHVVHLGGVKASPDPGHALFYFTQANGFNPTYDLLSAQWEYQDPVHHEWAVLPEISGPIEKGQLVPFPGGLYASNNPSYVSETSPATCLPQGRYRVQLFVNGHLAGTATASSDWPSLHAVHFSEVDGAMCAGQGWVPFQGGGPGGGGYTAHDLSAGASIISIPTSAAPYLVGNNSGQADVMNSYMKGFSGKLFPGIRAQTGVQHTNFFMSSTNGQKRFWSYNSGYVYSGVGESSNGQIYIGLAWAKQNQTAYDLFLSLSPL